MKKIRITKQPNPQLAYGGQSGYGLDVHTRGIYSKPTKEETSVNGTLQPVPREYSNLEAEQGETAVGDFDNDGMLEHMKIGGKPHSQGGTPLFLNPGTFIFSDTKKMRIGGPVLEMFGKPADTKKKFTPAELAKQYDLNKYKAILDDPNADPLKKKTAEMMMVNNQKKLGELALLQEAVKGFPSGIPNLALSTMQEFCMGGKVRKMDEGGAALPETVVTAKRPERFGQQPPYYFPTTPIQQEFQPVPIPDYTVPQSMYQPEPKQTDRLKVPDVTRSVSQTKQVPFDYTTPDKLGVLNAMYNLASIQKYTPWEAPVQAVTPTPTFYDPTRELSNNNALVNQSVQANMLLAGPGSRFRNSAIQGQGAENAANILGRYANMNTGVANQFAGITADITNNVLAEQRDRTNRLYDKNVVANQQYDNARREARSVLQSTIANAWKNRQQMDMLNQTTPDYYIDPASGRMTFKNDKSKETYFNRIRTGSQNAFDSMTGQYDQLVQRYGKEEALKIFQTLYGKRTPANPQD
jgi:hypothetical protein